MFTQNEKTIVSEVVQTVTITTWLILFFVAIVIFAIVRYQNKQKQYDDRKRELENEFVKASLEAREQTLEELSERLHGNLQKPYRLLKLT